MNEEEASSEPQYQLRRATLEDLPTLKEIWAAERLPVSDLEKRFTEFQLASGPDGRIVGMIALQIHKQHGHVHSEVFLNLDDAPALRPLLWQRVLTVARNHGLVRLWTMPTASFYREQGMAEVDGTIRGKLPEVFGSPQSDWISLKLKDENQNALLLEKEFEIFSQAERSSTEDLMRRAQGFKVIAYGLLILALGALAVLIFVTSRARKRL
jgi:N-acetylglutamate synthase-like GNAT family acetyltransferase